MYHVARKTAQTVSILLPLIFIIALGVFLVSLYDLFVHTLLDGTALARMFGIAPSGLSDMPLIPLLFSAATMFALVVLTDEDGL